MSTCQHGYFKVLTKGKQKLPRKKIKTGKNTDPPYTYVSPVYNIKTKDLKLVVKSHLAFCYDLEMRIESWMRDPGFFSSLYPSLLDS